MPNHVSNLLAFTGNVSKLERHTERVVDVDVLSIKLAALSILDKDAVELFELTDYQNVAECVQEWLDKYDRKQKQDVLDSLGTIYPKLIGLSKEFEETSLNNEVQYKDVDWYNFVTWAAIPVGSYLKSMFHGNAFPKLFEEVHGESISPCVPNLYEWKLLYMGTKSGIYGLSYDGNQIHFYSAWGPMNEAIMLNFVKFIEDKTETEFASYVFADQRGDFWGQGLINNGKFIYTDEGSIPLVLLTDDNMIIEYEQKGYYLLNDNYWSNKVKLPDGIRRLINFGLGG